MWRVGESGMRAYRDGKAGRGRDSGRPAQGVGRTGPGESAVSGPVNLTQATQMCIIDFAGADPSSHTEVVAT